MRLIVRTITGVLVFMFATAGAGATVISGTITAGSDGDGFEQALATNWNDTSEFSCTNASPFTVTTTMGPCTGQTVQVRFDVNGGGTSNNSHPFTYEVRCLNTELTHSVGFDGNERGSINNGVYFFQPSGETAVLAFTAEFEQVVPTLGEWGLIALALVVLTSGIVVVARRFRPTLAS